MVCLEHLCLSSASAIGLGIPLAVTAIYARRVLVWEFSLWQAAILLGSTLATWLSVDIQTGGLSHRPIYLLGLLFWIMLFCSGRSVPLRRFVSAPAAFVICFLSILIADLANAFLHTQAFNEAIAGYSQIRKLATPGGMGIVDGLLLWPALSGLTAYAAAFMASRRVAESSVLLRGDVRELLLSLDPAFRRPGETGRFLVL